MQLKPFKRNLFLGILISFLTCSLFSYPLHYVPVWFLLTFCALKLFLDETPVKELSKKTKVIIGAICFLGLLFFSSKMYLDLKWKKTATKSLQGKSEQMLPEYENMYPYLKYNYLFLYNYGAELNFTGQYKKSIKLLDECKQQFNDYDLQMLLADNYYHIGNTELAIKTYKYAELMIPCRFSPLYKQFEIHQKENDTGKANEIAKKIVKKIVKKQVKVKSSTVNWIVTKAENYLNEKRKQ